MATKSLAELLSTFSFLNLTADNKIFCDITKHEMPPKADIVMGHINGKKFKKTMEWYSYDYSEFEPYIVVDRQNSNKLHCKLTGMTLNKIPNEVKKHASGKKYLRLKKENEELQLKESTKEKDTNPDIWVPPTDLIESDDEEVPEGSKVKKEKKESNKQPKEIEEDTYSDLLGSDHEDDELDNDDHEDDFDDLNEDDNNKMDIVEKKKSTLPVKKDQKNKIVKNKPEKVPKLTKTVVRKESKNKLEKVNDTTKSTVVDKSQKRKETPIESKTTGSKKSKKV
mmetsp:Transcript_11874/g.11540  ORF Transcript_11874/g.11540 Transcript_11874/m.11540 type:complete len:281 (-) Transcript_11874:470-1312(-)